MTSPDQQLLKLRAEIDRIDEELAQLFIKRIGVIREVAALKAANWPGVCHIRPGREGQMHRAIAARFADSGFPPLMALAIWRQLIGGSTHRESPLSISYGVHFPEHLWLAREYFGIQVNAHKAEHLEDALSHMQSGKSNILLLPADFNAPCWAMARSIREAGLSLFASLPVVDKNLPKGTVGAWAFAGVNPENSGDDISYFVTKSGVLEAVDGFILERANALFLGAHPRPIRLTKGANHG
jgi:chorismate mutase